MTGKYIKSIWKIYFLIENIYLKINLGRLNYVETIYQSSIALVSSCLCSIIRKGKVGEKRIAFSNYPFIHSKHTIKFYTCNSDRLLLTKFM